ncbi:MAG: DNA polymerase IV, partial [Proteobacteria bacterium]|nr:DNA polymerase IV [Pseudomonadota bacterium]
MDDFGVMLNVTTCAQTHSFPQKKQTRTSSMEKRKIIHFDMDAFYASVEILDNPSLEGLPVVVGGNPNSRAVVCAASYAARKFGIQSAMPCSRAQRLCPDTIFLFPRFERYRELSSTIHGIFRKYTDVIEPLSLDEAWLDVTDNKVDCPSATWLAKMLKSDVRSETGLTGSAGVSYNKFLAKIASDEDKPDGLFVITPESSAEFLEKIAIGKIPGVGKVTQKRLQQLSIEKGHQLLEKTEDYLVKHLGKLGHYLFRIIRGIDQRAVECRGERKSVGIENTFAEDLTYGDDLKHA